MKVFVYIIDELADWELSFLLAELNSKRYFKNKDQPIEIVKTANILEPRQTMGGLSIIPDCRVDDMEISGSDILILPGSDNWFKKEHEPILLKAKTYIEQGIKVAAICGATFGLANVGALDNKRHTSNDKAFLKQVCKNYKGEHLYENTPAVTDGNLITATGIAPLEFTFEVLKLLNVFSEDTLINWYKLYTTKETKYFFELMQSLKNSGENK